MYMGIDIGTSAVKTVVLDEHGSVIDQASAPLDISRPQPLWSEQDPAHWWSATNSRGERSAASLAPGGTRHRFVGQMHGATLLDDTASRAASRDIVERRPQRAAMC
jgi:xylulokinase